MGTLRGQKYLETITLTRKDASIFGNIKPNEQVGGGEVYLETLSSTKRAARIFGNLKPIEQRGKNI